MGFLLQKEQIYEVNGSSPSYNKLLLEGTVSLPQEPNCLLYFKLTEAAFHLFYYTYFSPGFEFT